MAFPDTSIYVIATSRAGTSEALRHARRMAEGGRRIVLLVPVPYRPDASTLSASLIDEFTGIAATVGVTVHAYALVCKNPADIFLWFPVGPDAPIVVGAVRDHGAGEEARLVDVLRSMGHQVVFVGADGSGPASAASDVA